MANSQGRVIFNPDLTSHQWCKRQLSQNSHNIENRPKTARNPTQTAEKEPSHNPERPSTSGALLPLPLGTTLAPLRLQRVLHRHPCVGVEDARVVLISVHGVPGVEALIQLVDAVEDILAGIPGPLPQFTELSARSNSNSFLNSLPWKCG